MLIFRVWLESQHLCLSTQYHPLCHQVHIKTAFLKSAPLLCLEISSKLLTCIIQILMLVFSWLTEGQLDQLHQSHVALNFLLRLGSSSCLRLYCLDYDRQSFHTYIKDRIFHSLIYWAPSFLNPHKVLGLHIAGRCGIVATAQWYLFFVPLLYFHVFCLHYNNLYQCQIIV